MYLVTIRGRKKIIGEVEGRVAVPEGRGDPSCGKDTVQ